MKSEMTESDLLAIIPKDRYNIVRLLARGSSGYVYSATVSATSAPVVLKFVLFHDKASRARAEREIALVGKLAASPQIVPLIDYIFSPDGTAVILVSPFIEGGSLQNIIENYGSGLPNAVTAAIARQLCEGLQCLHTSNIIHRDIKPSNVLLASDGNASLCDLGIAISTEEQSMTVTKEDSFVGTMRYAAPEILVGETYSTASDVYSLGITIISMILGRQPLENSPMPFLIKQVLDGAFIKELSGSQNDVWRRILSTTLDINPLSRPSAAELHAILEEAFPNSGKNDEATIATFLSLPARIRGPQPSPPTALVPACEPDDSNSLKGTIQSLATQILEVQAAVADITATFKKRNVANVAIVTTQVDSEEKIATTFSAVRRRLEWNWRASLFMTAVLFSLFIAMLILAIVFGLIYQKSYWGILFGGTSVLSLLTVVVWKPMDKMLFSTIATQQLELIQLNYQRALSGSRQERREAFRDVSMQLNSLLQKISSK